MQDELNAATPRCEPPHCVGRSSKKRSTITCVIMCTSLRPWFYTQELHLHLSRKPWTRCWLNTFEAFTSKAMLKQRNCPIDNNSRPHSKMKARNVCQPKAEPASVSFWESAELRVSRTPRSDFWESANSESAERSQQSQLDLIQVWYGIVNFLPVNKFD